MSNPQIAVSSTRKVSLAFPGVPSTSMAEVAFWKPGILHCADSIFANGVTLGQSLAFGGRAECSDHVLYWPMTQFEEEGARSGEDGRACLWVTEDLFIA